MLESSQVTIGRGRKPRMVTEGGRKLIAHIRSLGMTVPDWCDAKGLDRFKVQKVINGQIQRVDCDFAQRAIEATGGAVQYTDFLSSTGRPPEPKNRSRARN
jgi:hypothetical protein